MNEKEIYVIKKIEELTSNNYKTISACLYDFKTWDGENDESTLIEMLQRLSSSNEGYSLEVSSIFVGTEPDGIDEIFIKKAGTKHIIVINYFDRYIVLDEKIAIKLITDWCVEKAKNPEIPALCDKLKEKYGL